MKKLGYCWTALSLIFSANCAPVIAYFCTDRSSDMSELQAPTKKLNLTLKQTSQRLNLKRCIYVCHLFHVHFWIIKFIIQKTDTFFFFPGGQTEQISVKHCISSKFSIWIKPFLSGWILTSTPWLEAWVFPPPLGSCCLGWKLEQSPPFAAQSPSMWLGALPSANAFGECASPICCAKPLK